MYIRHISSQQFQALILNHEMHLLKVPNHN